MATQPALMPIEQYLRTRYSPDVDLVEERKLTAPNTPISANVEAFFARLD